MSVTAKTAWWSATTSWPLATAIATVAPGRGFSHMVLITWTPPLTLPRPHLITWAPAGGLRKCTALSYCTPCIETI
jgi:hypothetical protein